MPQRQDVHDPSLRPNHVVGPLHSDSCIRLDLDRSRATVLVDHWDAPFGHRCTLERGYESVSDGLGLLRWRAR